jgi:hypothetical protein
MPNPSHVCMQCAEANLLPLVKMNGKVWHFKSWNQKEKTVEENFEHFLESNPLEDSYIQVPEHDAADNFFPFLNFESLVHVYKDHFLEKGLKDVAAILGWDDKKLTKEMTAKLVRHAAYKKFPDIFIDAYLETCVDVIGWKQHHDEKMVYTISCLCMEELMDKDSLAWEGNPFELVKKLEKYLLHHFNNFEDTDDGLAPCKTKYVSQDDWSSMCKSWWKFHEDRKEKFYTKHKLLIAIASICNDVNIDSIKELLEQQYVDNQVETAIPEVVEATEGAEEKEELTKTSNKLVAKAIITQDEDHSTTKSVTCSSSRRSVCSEIKE